MLETPTQRRSFLLGLSALTADQALGFPVCSDSSKQVCNVTRLYSVQSERVVPVQQLDDIQIVLKRSNQRVSIGGGRYSMGGQTALLDGIQLDMRSYKQLLWLNIAEKTVRVQAGMRWNELQRIIDPHDLSVQTMQSFANFTIGGSVSVNCHGRYVGHGAIVHSIRSLQLVLADGQALEANTTSNAALFYAAIGGYGSVGIITEVELNLDDNFKIERKSNRVSLMEYPDWFASEIQGKQSVLLHNADLTPSNFESPFCVTWLKSQQTLTQLSRLQIPKKNYAIESLGLWALTELPAGHRLRILSQNQQDKTAVVWRNFEAGLDVKELEPLTKQWNTYVLQEYFVPTKKFRVYAQALSAMLQKAPNGTVNVSIRHSKADSLTPLSWANEDVFCFVVYYKQNMRVKNEINVALWTQALIDLVLAHQGKYYLPYQLHASKKQFEQAYPNSAILKKLRQELGASRLSNSLLERYNI